MSDWKIVKLGDIAVYVNRGVSPKYTEKNGIIVINQKCIRNGNIDFSLARLHNYDKKFADEKILQRNDILINSTGVGTAGRVGIFIEDSNVIVDSHVSIVRLNNEVVYPKFIFYNLRKREKELEGTAEGSTGQVELKRDGIKQLDILLPLIEEQKAIAEVLSSIDDKINLLHSQNRTLEELAQTLFKQWFIEEANDEWEEYEVRDFATHKKVSIKPAQNPDNNYLHFSLPAFDTNKEPNITIGLDIKSNKYQVEPFSILMSKLNPKTQRVWDIYFVPKENSICSTEFQVVQPNDKSLFPFISTLLKSARVTGELAMSASGTSGSHQRVKPEDIFNISFVTPSIDRIKEFSELLAPNYLKRMKNQNQIQTLENMVDTLLPKLMSGEVRVDY